MTDDLEDTSGDEQDPAATIPPAVPGQQDKRDPEPPEPAAGEDTPQPQKPEAFYKAQAEKYERLFKKAEGQMETLQGQIQTMEDAQKEAFQTQLDEMKQSFETEAATLKDDLQEAELRRLRMEAMAVAEWSAEDIEELGEFVSGETPEDIQAQVETLGKRLQRPAANPPRSRVGNAGGSDKQVRDVSFIKNYLRGETGGGPFRRSED